MKDAFGREINYARISLTDKCNLRCRYCMPEEGVAAKKHGDLLSFEELEKVVDALLALGIEKVRVTGGEPLVRKDALRFIQNIGKKPDIKSLCITTNGVLLKEYASDLFLAGVNRLNISLDTLDSEKYASLTRRGDLTTVLEGIKASAKCGFEKLKLNVVLMKGLNEYETDDFIAFAKNYGMELRFIELMPFCSQQNFASDHYVAASEIISRYPQWQYVGSRENSVAEYYDAGNGFLVGFIKPLSDKFCARCNRVRITADGFILPCLHTGTGFDLKPHLNGDLAGFIAHCIKEKPLAHHLECGASQILCMNEIGG